MAKLSLFDVPLYRLRNCIICKAHRLPDLFNANSLDGFWKYIIHDVNDDDVQTRRHNRVVWLCLATVFELGR